MAETQDSAAPRARPMAPHLQVYRWQVTMAASILHRITGVGLAIGTVLLTIWLLALAGGAESYDMMQGFLGSWFGRLLLFGFTGALMYHFCNGIRHLFWDTGRGFDPATASKTAIAGLSGAAILTVLVWVLAYTLGGLG